jgi:hypothetical protein
MRNRDIYSNELANGDRSDDKQIEDQDDPEDDITDDNGFVNSFKRPGDIAQVRRSSRFNLSQMRNRDIYSNELANGDKSDDKQIEDQDDPEDDITDDNGFVNSFKRHGDIAQITRSSRQMRPSYSMA